MNISQPHSSSLPPLALIAGPTASGKSALAMGLGARVEATIINADSAQVYRELRTVTARPGPEEEALVPHRLYGTCEGAMACSAAEWARAARDEIAEAHRTGRLPILVGGTGLYLRILIDGIAPIPAIDPSIRAEARALPAAEAHGRLSREDPAAAERLRPTDTARVVRALEVIRSTRRPLAEWQNERIGGIGGEVELRPLILLPPRLWLRARCDRRFEAMFGDEGLSEVATLLARGLSPALPVMRAIGVRQMAAFLRGEIAREEALEAGRAATRQYAKRQYTWFSRQPPAHWPRFEKALDGPAEAGEAMNLLAADRESAALPVRRVGSAP